MIKADDAYYHQSFDPYIYTTKPLKYFFFKKSRPDVPSSFKSFLSYFRNIQSTRIRMTYAGPVTMQLGRKDQFTRKARQSRFLVSHQRPLVLKHCRFNFHYCIFKVTRPLYLHVILKHVSSSWHVIFSLYEKLQAGSLEFALNATLVTGL